MIGRRLNMDKYRNLQEDLLKNAHIKPLCPIYEVDIVFNNESYCLYLQPERHNKIYALYALRSAHKREKNAVNHKLITDNLILSALLEMVLYQGVKTKA